jgi:hypothetical protein
MERKEANSMKINNASEHKAALQRLDAIMHEPAGTKEFEEAEVLIAAIEEYELPDVPRSPD